MRLAKQSTTVTIEMGPAVDKTDGVTAETALSPTVYLSKAGAAQAARNSATAITHDRDGFYRVELNTTDTNTLGPLIVQFTDAATHLPVWHELLVVPANVYDSLVSGSDKLDVDTFQVTAAAITAASIAADAITDAKVAADVTIASVTGAVGSVTGNVGGNVVGSVASVTADVGITQTGADKVWGSATRALTDKAGFALSAAGVQAIWDALTTALTTVGSVGKRIADNLDATVSSRLASAGYTAPDNASITTILSRTDVATSTRSSHTAADVWAAATRTLTSFGTLAADVWASATRTLTSGAAPSAASIADAVWDEAISGHLAAGSTGLKLNASGGAAGSGAITHTHTAYRSVGVPADGALCWVTTDAAGTNVIASGYTNASGVVAFYLDAGTYYLWQSLSGVNFTNPVTITVA